jgi:hypothetical protein
MTDMAQFILLVLATATFFLGRSALKTLGIVVWIHEIISRVVGRVDVDHLDFADLNVHQRILVITS